MLPTTIDCTSTLTRLGKQPFCHASSRSPPPPPPGSKRSTLPLPRSLRLFPCPPLLSDPHSSLFSHISSTSLTHPCPVLLALRHPRAHQPNPPYPRRPWKMPAYPPKPQLVGVLLIFDVGPRPALAAVFVPIARLLTSF
jgi:hypothetical protein